MVMAVHRLLSANWLLLIAERRHRVVQGGLVCLDADQEGVVRRGRAGEAPFWQCSASAVKSTPVRPSSAMRSGTAATSSGAPATSWCARISALSLAKALNTCARSEEHTSELQSRQYL